MDGRGAAFFAARMGRGGGGATAAAAGAKGGLRQAGAATPESGYPRWQQVHEDRRLGSRTATGGSRVKAARGLGCMQPAKVRHACPRHRVDGRDAGLDDAHEAGRHEREPEGVDRLRRRAVHLQGQVLRVRRGRGHGARRPGRGEQGQEGAALCVRRRAVRCRLDIQGGRRDQAQAARGAGQGQGGRPVPGAVVFRVPEEDQLDRGRRGRR